MINRKMIFNKNSNTHRFNLVVMAGALLVLPMLKDVIEPETYPIILASVTFIHHILRNTTKTAITDR